MERAKQFQLKSAVVCFCFRTVTSPKTMVSVSLVPFTCTCAYVQCMYIHSYILRKRSARALVFLSAMFNCERVGAFLLSLLGSIRLHIVRVVCCCCCYCSATAAAAAAGGNKCFSLFPMHSSRQLHIETFATSASAKTPDNTYIDAD